MLPTPNPDIAFHAFAGGGALHYSGSHRLWVLNVTAATLWCLMDGRHDNRALADAYARRFDLDDATARRDVKTLLSHFAEEGLLNGGNPAKEQDIQASHPLETPLVYKRLQASLSGLPRMTFSLAGHCFAVAGSTEGIAGIQPTLFRHLAVPDAAERTELVFRSEGAQDRPSFTCYENGLGCAENLTPEGVTPFLVYRLFEQCMASLDQRLLFHAAVVAQDGRVLLLPAQSGSGKSTLAAALSASGWTYLSDELAVLDPQTLCVEPFALPIGLKDKSMTALADFIPAVADLPRHVRMDGVGIRYLPPPSPPRPSPLPVSALVFPCYKSAAPAAITALKPLEALQRLTDTGSSARPLMSQDIKAMLQLASLPSYTLTFSDLERAVEAIKERFGFYGFKDLKI